MKSEMRRSLARESFEEKIRKVGQLIHLVKLTRQKAANSRAPASALPPNVNDRGRSRKIKTSGARKG